MLSLAASLLYHMKKRVSTPFFIICKKSFEPRSLEAVSKYNGFN